MYLPNASCEEINILVGSCNRYENAGASGAAFSAEAVSAPLSESLFWLRYQHTYHSHINNTYREGKKVSTLQDITARLVFNTKLRALMDRTFLIKFW